MSMLGGPRTVAGKRQSAKNGLRHGLRSSKPVIIGVESEEEWEAFRRDYVTDLAPVGAVETALAERVALGFWRLRRCVRAETAAANALVAATRAGLEESLGLSEAADLVRPVIEDAAVARACGEVPTTRTPLECKALGRFRALGNQAERTFDRVVDVLALGPLDEAELRLRYETSAWRFLRDALGELSARQAVRLAKYEGAEQAPRATVRLLKRVSA